MICKHCDDQEPAWQCPICDNEIKEECWDCHFELNHGSTPCVTDAPGGLSDCHDIHRKQYSGDQQADY